MDEKDLPVHAANGFKETICGINFNDTVPLRMTNIKDFVNCPDCITIRDIKEKNRIKYCPDCGHDIKKHYHHGCHQDINKPQACKCKLSYEFDLKKIEDQL